MRPLRTNEGTLCTETIRHEFIFPTRRFVSCTLKIRLAITSPTQRTFVFTFRCVLPQCCNTTNDVLAHCGDWYPLSTRCIETVLETMPNSSPLQGPSRISDVSEAHSTC
ncbi:hypothetical protein QTP88_018051 [Uroleucon formosanum]